MFFEGAFEAAGLGLDYADFSVRIAERDLPDLVTTLRAIPPARVAVMRRKVLLLRDYFVYKDMYSPSASHRKAMLALGRPGQDAFLLLALALEARARALGVLKQQPGDDAGGLLRRVRAMLNWPEEAGALPPLPDVDVAPPDDAPGQRPKGRRGGGAQGKGPRPLPLHKGQTTRGGGRHYTFKEK